jgi:glycosyltransferase involved in cell wall biosynthesis
MIVAIDCRALSGDACGIYRYTKGLLPALARLDSENEFLLFSDARIPDHLLPRGSGNFRQVLISGASTLAWEQVHLPRALKRVSADIFHCPRNHGIGYFTSCASILTIHDLIPRLFKEYWVGKSWLGRCMYNLGLKISVSKARHIIVDSHSTKKDVMKVFRIPEPRVSVIYPSLDESLSLPRGGDARSLLKRLNVPQAYLLHIAGNGFHKNTVRLLRVYALLKRRRTDIPPLVIAGNAGRDQRGRGENSGVVFTGPVTDEEMAALYALAKVFVYPSLYEGFGLPVLEAFSAGAPVITSRGSSLPEVGGEAVFYVDPDNDDDLALSIERLIDAPSLRAELVKKARERLPLFSWDRAARQTLEVYRRVYHEDL